jgi:hypothetical protein
MVPLIKNGSNTQNGDSDLEDGHAGNTKMASLISIDIPDESKEERMNLVLASANGAASTEADAKRVGAIEESKNCNQSADVVPDLVVLWLGQPCARLVCVTFFLASSFIFLTVRPSALGVLMTILMAINYCLYVVWDMLRIWQWNS